MKATYYLLPCLILFSAHPLTGEEADKQPAHFKLDVMARVPSPVEPAPKIIGCRFSDVLKYKKGTNPNDPDVPTIVLGKIDKLAGMNKTKKSEVRDYVISTIGNLTRFDEQAVRDEIAGILEGMPCEPEAEVVLYFTAMTRTIDKVPEGARHGRVVNSFQVAGCIEVMPADCNFPTADASYDADSALVTYDDMMKTVKRCKEQVIEKVEKEGLRQKWAAEIKKMESDKNEGSKAVPATPSEGKTP